MRKKVIILAVLLIIPILLLSQQRYDEVKIRLRQAKQLKQAGRKDIAKRIYEQLINDYPDNVQIINELYNFYIEQKDLAQAQKLLEDKSIYLGEINKITKEIELSILDNNIKQANEKADLLLKKYSQNMNLYRQLAAIFIKNSIFDKAISIYQKARTVANDKYLYSREIATVYEYQNDYKSALNEYLLQLESNVSNYNYIRYKIKNFVNRDSTILDILREKVSADTSMVYKRIYAAMLLEVNDYQQAFNINKKLNIKYLLSFADQCYHNELYELAIQAYQQYLLKSNDKLVNISVHQKLASIYFILGNHKLERDALENIIAEKNLKDRSIRFRTRAFFNAFLKLANLSIILEDDYNQAKAYLDRANQYSFNQNDKNLVQLEIGKIYLFQGKYDKAEKIFNDVNNNQKIEAKVRNLATYHLALLYLFQNDLAVFDTLILNFVNSSPENKLINDAMDYQASLNQVSESIRNDLVTFIKLKISFQQDKAEEKLLQLINNTKKEDDLYILKKILADFYFQHRKFAQALEIYLSLYNEENPLYVEYVLKRIGDCYHNQHNKVLAKQYYEDYLLKYFDGAYATEIRQILADIMF